MGSQGFLSLCSYLWCVIRSPHRQNPTKKPHVWVKVGVRPWIRSVRVVLYRASDHADPATYLAHVNLIVAGFSPEKC